VHTRVLTIRLISALAITTPLWLASPALAQSPTDLEGIKQELRGLREAQEATAKDVEAIRTMLQQAMGPHPAPSGGAAAQAAASTMPLTVGGRPSKGNPHAAITVVEYSDYGCPYCGQYAAEIAPRIDRDYVKTGKVNYVFKNYPIAQLHPMALKAHVAAACAGDQGRYWEMHDKLFAEQRFFDLDRFVEHASALKLDPVAFRSCVESGKHEPMIREDIAEAQNGGVQGTPVFVLAFTDPAGKTVTPARVIVGAQPFEAFKEAIDAMLAQAATTPSRTGVHP
jgi:protein-disulfide isomerase